MSASSDLILKESPYPRPLFLISSSLLGSSHSISPCLLFLCPDLIFSHLFFCNVGFQHDLQRNFAKHRSSLQKGCSKTGGPLLKRQIERGKRSPKTKKKNQRSSLQPLRSHSTAIFREGLQNTRELLRRWQHPPVTLTQWFHCPL